MIRHSIKGEKVSDDVEIEWYLEIIADQVWLCVVIEGSDQIVAIIDQDGLKPVPLCSKLPWGGFVDQDTKVNIL